MPGNNFTPSVLVTPFSVVDTTGTLVATFGFDTAGNLTLSKGISVSDNGFGIGKRSDFPTIPAGLFLSQFGDGANVTGNDEVQLSAGGGVVNFIFLAEGGIANGTGNFILDAENKLYDQSGNIVVSARQAAIADATGAGDVVARLNDLLAAMRAHGLIAT